jgi:hypothetical protein
MDHEKRTSFIFQVWAQKLVFVNEVTRWNPYNTKAFAWVDIGSFRAASQLEHFKGFPDARKFPHNRICLLAIAMFEPKELAKVDVIDERFRYADRLGGGIITGNRDAFSSFLAKYLQVFKEARRVNVLAGKEQTIYNFVVLRNPDLFRIVDASSLNSSIIPDRWFALHYLFSSSSNPLFKPKFYPKAAYTGTRSPS